MNTNRIFIGNLMCDKNEIGQSVFLKVGEDYVFLDDVNNLLDMLKIKSKTTKIPKLNTIKNGYYYIDKSSLKPFYEKNTNKSLKKIKEDYLLDSRNPKGINM